MRARLVCATLVQLGVVSCASDDPAPMTPAPTPPHAFETKWGSAGTGDGQFTSGPHAVATDAAGIYVVDFGTPRVQKFSTSGAFIAQWGSAGSGDGQFTEPFGIAADGAGNLYVGDGDGRVQKFTNTGTFVAVLGTPGTGDGQFISPTGLAVDPTGGYLFVVDSEQHQVQKLTTTGVFVLKWGTVGSGDGEFGLDAVGDGPLGVAVDAGGLVYVTDTGNQRVQKFNRDGVFLGKWGTMGTGNGEFKNAEGIAIDRSTNPNRVYISESAFAVAPDPGNHRVQEFKPDGSFVTLWGSHGSGDGQFRLPQGIAVDAGGHIYVTDYENSRVQKFAP